MGLQNRKAKNIGFHAKIHKSRRPIGQIGLFLDFYENNLSNPSHEKAV
jgi:hypothetical protein